MLTRLLPLLLLPSLAFAAAPRVERPASQRLLSRAEEARVVALLDRANKAVAVNKFADALEAAREAHQVRAAKQGARHWQTIDTLWEVKLVEQVAPLKELDRRRLFVAIRRSNELADLVRKGDGAEAVRLGGRIVEFIGNTLGPDHPWLAEAQSRLGWVHDRLGKPHDAAPLHESALRIREKQFGRDHPSTALACERLARNLEARGDPFRAGPLYEQTLLAALRLYGRGTAEEADALRALGTNLTRRGRYADAHECHLRALKLRREHFAERHADTAQSYGDLGDNYLAGGQAAEARLLLDRALDLREEVHGLSHPATARAFARLAECQFHLGRFPEAEALRREELKARQSTQGDDHDDTAHAIDELARTLRRQGKPIEAGKLYESALAGWRKRLGDGHLRTAHGLSAVAGVLGEIDRHREALPPLQRALAIKRRNHGDNHPEALRAFADLATGLANVGEERRAAILLEHVLDKRRALLGERHPDTEDTRYRLADCLARLGDLVSAERLCPSDTFAAATLLAALRLRTQKPADAFEALERSLAYSLLDDGSAAEGLLSGEDRAKHVERNVRVAALQRQVESLTGERAAKARQEYDRACADLAELVAALAAKHGAAGGLSLPLADIQKQLSTDTAIVGWVDRPRRPLGGSWACVIRDRGDPIWVELKGSGKNGEWTDEDDGLVLGLRKALADPKQGWLLAASHAYRLWLAPLAKHLVGVRRLIALPSRRLRGIPLEVLKATKPKEAEDAPKWTTAYAPSATVYAELRRRAKPAQDASLLAFVDPTFATYEAEDKKVLTRNGLAQRPGARREVEAIAGLFSTSEVFVGNEASEAKLDALSRAGKLRDYRYLHLAAHALANPDRPMLSTLYLADRELPNPFRELLQGRPVRLGRVTAGRIASEWRLDADLVTLSAGETGQGEYAMAESRLGLARGLFAAGARSVLLSQWPTDDEATTLLFARFYENLLGKRGLAKPMPKAEALDEAKRWLRGLLAKEVRQRVEALPGKQGAKERKEARPFEHPHYWAGFVLVGDWRASANPHARREWAIVVVSGEPGRVPLATNHPGAAAMSTGIVSADDLFPFAIPVRAGTDALDELKYRVLDRLTDQLDLEALKRLPEQDRRGELRLVALRFLAAEDPALDAHDRESIVIDLVDELVGLGPLDRLLRESGEGDIVVNGPFDVWVERKGRLEPSPVRFRDELHLMQIIERIVARVGRRIDDSCPMVDARLPDGSRFNAVIAPLSLKGPALSIRRFSATPLTMDRLLELQALTPEMARLMEAAVKGRLNVVVSGGTGSGKTTLLNALSRYIPDHERLITIEDAAELRLQQRHVLPLETRPANLDGKNEVTIRDLVRNALRMRPDRIIIGECRGAEAVDMLQAMNTGHDGSLTSLHANGPRDALTRLETMMLMAGFEVPLKALRRQIESAVDLVIQAERLAGGRRRVTAMTEVVGMEGDVIVTQDIYQFRQEGLDSQGRARGRFLATGVRPAFAARLEAAGQEFVPGMFAQRTLMHA